MSQGNPDVTNTVGQAAGEIFRYLESRDSRSDLNTLRRDLRHMSETVLLQGMGWLMREGKLTAHQPQGTAEGNYQLQLRR